MFFLSSQAQATKQLAQCSWTSGQHVTFQRQIYSLSFGGLLTGTGSSGLISDSSSCSGMGVSSGGPGNSSVPTLISRASGDAPKFWTAGSPLLSHRSFRVKRGPISCRATFSGERKAYLIVSVEKPIHSILVISLTDDVWKTKSHADCEAPLLVAPEIQVMAGIKSGTFVQHYVPE